MYYTMVDGQKSTTKKKKFRNLLYNKKYFHNYNIDLSKPSIYNIRKQ